MAFLTTLLTTAFTWAGERMLDVSAIPASIQPLQLEHCGNYALKIDWNDGHNTGLFTWERLHGLCLSDSSFAAEPTAS